MSSLYTKLEWQRDQEMEANEKLTQNLTQVIAYG